MDQLAPRQTPALQFKRGLIFHGTRLVCFALCGLGAFAVAQHFTGERWGILRWNLYVLAILFWRWGAQLGAWICRGLGLSLEGTEINKVERSATAAFSVTHQQTPLVIERAKFAGYIMPICTTLLCVICFGPTLLTCTPPTADLEKTAILTSFFSVLLAVAIFTWSNVRKPALSIDSRGIAYCQSLGFYSRSANWSQIHSCEIASVHDVFGKLTRKYLVLRDASQRELMTVIFDSRSPEQNTADLDLAAKRIEFELTGTSKEDSL